MSDENSKVGACERCHRRKARCDKLQPACSSCVKADAQCNYSTRDPVARRQEIEKLERRLRQMEAKNEALTAQLRAAQQNTRQLHQSRDGRLLSPGDVAMPHANNESHESSNNNEVAGQVSSLSLDAGGDKQYLGSASGLLLATLLQADSKARSLGRQGEETNSASRRFGTGVRSDLTTPDASALPAEKLARSLLLAYLAHDHLCYPFLHPRKLIGALEATYADNAFYKTHPVEAFWLDMVFAIATAQVSKFDWQVMPDAETHHERATSKLSAVLHSGGLVALQSILLLCQYRIGSGLHDTSASLWHLVGMAARMCFELGLHKESVYCSPQEDSPEVEQVMMEESEIKRRCFFSVFAMDRIVSITLGRPMAIHLEDIDAELPQTQANLPVSPDNQLSPSEPFTSPSWQLRTAIFVHIVRYRRICGKILSSLHNKNRLGNIDATSIRSQLADELLSWRAGTASLPLTGSLADDDKSSFRTREWYDLLYENGILMLYRPSSTTYDMSLNSGILQSIFNAAQKSITIYAYLHKSRRINYSSITLHAVFIAGLSYIYAIKTHFQGRRRTLRATVTQSPSEPVASLLADPTIGQIANDTRACSNVLVAVSERQSSARNTPQVFGSLSDALLADVIDFQSEAASLHSRSSTFMGTNTNLFASSSLPYSPAMQPSLSANLAQNVFDCSYQNPFDELQGLYDHDFANAAMMQASQDWLFEIQALDQSLTNIDG